MYLYINKHFSITIYFAKCFILLYCAVIQFTGFKERGGRGGSGGELRGLCNRVFMLIFFGKTPSQHSLCMVPQFAPADTYPADTKQTPKQGHVSGCVSFAFLIPSPHVQPQEQAVQDGPSAPCQARGHPVLASGERVQGDHGLGQTS